MAGGGYRVKRGLELAFLARLLGCELSHTVLPRLARVGALVDVGLKSSLSVAACGELVGLALGDDDLAGRVLAAGAHLALALGEGGRVAVGVHEGRELLLGGLHQVERRLRLAAQLGRLPAGGCLALLRRLHVLAGGGVLAALGRVGVVERAAHGAGMARPQAGRQHAGKPVLAGAAQALDLLGGQGVGVGRPGVGLCGLGVALLLALEVCLEGVEPVGQLLHGGQVGLGLLGVELGLGESVGGPGEARLHGLLLLDGPVRLGVGLVELFHERLRAAQAVLRVADGGLAGLRALDARLEALRVAQRLLRRLGGCARLGGGLSCARELLGLGGKAGERPLARGGIRLGALLRGARLCQFRARLLGRVQGLPVPLVAGQLLAQGARAALQLGHGGAVVLGLVARVLQAGQRGLKAGEPLLGACQVAAGLGRLLGAILRQGEPVVLGARLGERLGGLVVPALREGQLVVERLQHAARIEGGAAHPPLDAPARLVALGHGAQGLLGQQLHLVVGLPALGGKLVFAGGQLVLEAAVEVGAEYLAEYLGALGGALAQQLLEVPLGQHHDLAELVGVDAQKLGDLGVHRLAARELAAVGQLDAGVAFAFGGAAAALLVALVAARVAHDAVALAAQVEREVHVGLGVGAGEVAAQVLGLAALARAAAEQGERDRVEHGGLARARLAGQ